MPQTIVLADDHPIVRQGLRAVLDAEPDYEVVGEASDGLETLAVVERLKPSLLIVDVMMPGLNGLEVTRRVVERSPHTRVIVLSIHADEAHVLEALRYGAAGYALKDVNIADLTRGLREVAAGRRYLSPPLSEHAIDAYAKRAASSTSTHETLTPREREILQLVAEGHTSAEIGVRLGISPRTVEVHRANLLHKLSLRTQADVIRYAIRRGLLPPDG
ncbi:MAG: DNA-binding response regulator [Armatimonadetes bacterium 13_1_40CM_64_14]|nr:MAG: DNA-binding response regulator [Armatimonadetes bacterium 13_1_40CM_64_14]